MPSVTFNDREMRAMAQAWQCFKTQPDIDYARLAKVGGFCSAGSAGVVWRRILAKIKAAGDGDITDRGLDSPGSNSPSAGSPLSLGSGASSKKRGSPSSAASSPPKRPKRATKKVETHETPSEDDEELSFDREAHAF